MIDTDLIADKLHDLSGVLNQAQELIDEIRVLTGDKEGATMDCIERSFQAELQGHLIDITPQQESRE